MDKLLDFLRLKYFFNHSDVETTSITGDVLRIRLRKKSNFKLFEKYLEGITRQYGCEYLRPINNSTDPKKDENGERVKPFKALQSDKQFLVRVSPPDLTLNPDTVEVTKGKRNSVWDFLLTITKVAAGKLFILFGFPVPTNFVAHPPDLTLNPDTKGLPDDILEEMSEFEKENYCGVDKINCFLLTHNLTDEERVEMAKEHNCLHCLQIYEETPGKVKGKHWPYLSM